MASPKTHQPSTVRTRLQHSQENTLDYLKVIAELIEHRGEARVIDIADALHISKATVSKKLLQLQREGLVRSEPYRSIFLEPQGARMASAGKIRHTHVLDFLLAIGVPQEIAEDDAEGIEHHVSPQTVRALREVTRKLNEESDKPEKK